jgi:hypothetical protein
VRTAGPEREQHGALEDEQSGISRLTQTKEEPFQPVPQENEVEILAALFGQVEKPLANGRDQIARGPCLHETTASR